MTSPSRLGRSRRGSILIIVVWMLLGASLIIYATQMEALEAQRSSYANFQRQCSIWAAKGGVHYSIGYMNTFAPQPALVLDIKPPPAFYTSHRKDLPIGWFIAEYPHPSDDTLYGITSEQGRMPLSKLTTSAINILFPDGVKQAFKDHVTKKRAATGGSGPKEEQAKVFRHPFELFAIAGITPELVFGQDWNDNGVLDPFEANRSGTTPPTLVPDNRGGAVDRGLIDFVTTFTDEKFNPYDTTKKLRQAYLGDWDGGVLSFFDSADKRPPPQIAKLGDKAWETFANEQLTNTTAYFRIQCFGTLREEPMGRVRCVAQYVQETDATKNWYQIMDWRQDE